MSTTTARAEATLCTSTGANRYLFTAARIGLALAACALRLEAPPAALLVAGLLLGYAVAAPFIARLWRTGANLFTLCVDLVFWLLISASAGEGEFWLVSGFLCFLHLSATVFDRWPQAALVTIASLGFLQIVKPPFGERLLPVVALLGALSLLFSLWKRSLERGLYHASSQTVQARQEAGRARESERERIAAAFHDGPLQIFVAVQVRLEVVRKLLERDTTRGLKELSELQKLFQSQVAELRSFVRTMRSEGDHGTLGDGVRRLVEAFRKDTGIQASYASGGAVLGPNSAAVAELLLLVQEALHNVRKHSGASKVSVAAERDGGDLVITVSDNGQGFPFSGLYTLEELDLLRLGPVSIRRRVRTLHGDMTLESRPGSGASLKIRIPA